MGYIYGVITEGFGIMPDYSSQIPPMDRWRIVAYVRALQLSQHASPADAAGHPIPATAPAFLDPGTGATLPRVKPPDQVSEGIEMRHRTYDQPRPVGASGHKANRTAVTRDRRGVLGDRDRAGLRESAGLFPRLPRCRSWTGWASVSDRW